MQRAAMVGGYEVYPLIGETAVHVVGRPIADAKYVSLLNESLSDETTVLADDRLVVDRQPTEQIGSATSG